MQKHLAVSTPHSAVNVDVVTSPRGLKFWLVPSHAVPLVSLEFAMRGGSAQDPAEKAGLGALMSGLLDEGRAISIRRRFTAPWTRSRSKCRSIATAIIGAGACAR